MPYKKFPLPVWTTNKDFQVIDCNDAANIFSEDLFCGLTTNDIQLLQKLHQGEQEKLCLQRKCGDTYQWIDWQSWTEDSGIIFIADDVTIYKNNESYLKQILDSIPDMILVKEKDSKIKWANKAFQEHYGMSNEELDHIIDAPFQPSANTEQYVKDDAWVRDHKKSLVIECETVLRYDGVERQFQTIKSPILDPEGKTELTVGVSRDITEKLVQEQKSIAASKMASLGEMAGGVAHEINNPISIVLGKTQQMKRTYTDPKEIEDLDVIERNAYRIAKIVEGLRNFCQDENKQMPTFHKMIDVLNETLSYCSDRITREKIHLSINVPEDVQFFGKKIQISQIILNLINNAIDSIAGQNEPLIKISCKQVNGFMELRVQDSGTGVPREIESKIMQPFFTTKEIGKGIGLGLSISYAIALKHGGSLSLDRSISPSCFLLKIPAPNE